MYRYFAAVAIVALTAHGLSAQGCPSRPLLAFQVHERVQVLPDSALDHTMPEIIQSGHGEANIVQFLVDSSGLPVPSSLKILSLRDSAMFASFVRGLPKRRFRPARDNAGCRVTQVVMAAIAWPKP